MRKVLIVLAILAIVYNSAEAGIFKDDVDLADLSTLSQDSLETLKDTEFDVFLMKVKHAGAKASENKANDDLKTAQLILDAKRQRHKSAEADLKEAKATQDSARIDAAEKALHNAKKELEHAKLLIQWKEKEVDVKAARVKKAKLAVSVAEHERDLARVSKLKEQNVPSAAKYSLSDFNKRLEKKQRDYQKAVSTEAKEMTEAKKRKAVYDSSSP
jgi:hypothetical protein